MKTESSTTLAPGAEKKRNFVTSFVVGARKGFSMSMNNMAPNVLFAFAIIHILNLSGLSTVIGKFFGPVMGVFGLPGIAATVVMAALLSTGGGVGAAASLALNGDINAAQTGILLVGIMMFGSLVQYIGRVLGTADVDSKHYPVLIVTNIVCGLLAMLIASFILGR